ncbi:helix-turn-helix domain-containing protein [Paenibacillus agaridevorans]|uniref:helix-turn-helix domain-containing protein n=1 Tax=Paenibacillus agaridevorans TaxID=171404 RepID=UPI001BE47541|nr:helix-turn-helix domain-containing protein [Paenibacillus agaridevorans]
MIGKLLSKRKSILITWLLSYLAVLFVPIGLSILIYFEADRVLKSEVHRANDTLLRQVQEVMDKQIEEINRLYVEILWDAKMQSLMYSNRPENEKLYLIYEITKKFNWFKTVFANVSKFYVYWKEGDGVLLPGTMQDSRLAYEVLHNDDEFGYAAWLSLLEREDHNGFHTLPTMEDRNSRKSLAYISPMPQGQNKHIIGSVVIMLDSARLLQMIQNVQSYNGGQIFILNGADEVLISNSDMGEDRLSFLNRLAGDKAFFHDAYRGGSEIMYVRSETADLKYVSVIPRRFVWEKVEHVRTFTYVSIVVSLLGGSVLTLIFLRKNYMPVKRLVRTFAVQQEVLEEQPVNEFQYIQRMVSSALSEKEQFSLKLRMHNQLMKSNTLVRLLKGKAEGALSLEDALTSFDISFRSDLYSVLLLYFEDEEPFFARIKGDNLNEKYRLRQFIVTNVVQEITSRQHQGFVTDIDEGMACLINYEENALRLRDDRLRMAEEIEQFLLREFRIKLIIAVSSIQTSINGIAYAYQEAKDALEYSIVTGKRETVLYDQLHQEMRPETGAGYYYPLQVEQQLINYMKLGDYAKSREVLDEIKNKNFGDLAGSVHIIKCLLYNLVSTMIKAVNESDGVGDSFFVNNSKRIDAIMQGETIQGMYDKLCELLQEICADLKAKRELQAQHARNHSLEERIKEVARYVEMNYDDIHLNISTIGEHFHMKASYLSKLFKDQTSEGLLEFINKVRIERAKEIIADEGIAIGEVAGRVGFSEAATFIRIFKKYERITPGQYKELTMNRQGDLP